MRRKLTIWFTEIGEPLPQEQDQRLHRYGMLTQFLAQRGHDVTWWTSTFTHANKRFVRDGDTVEFLNGVTIRMLKGPGYQRNISPQRFKHQAHFAGRFGEEARKLSPPDLLISPVPTLETADVAVRYGLEVKRPVLTDIRDEWPEDFARLAPKPLRWAARLVLSSYYTKIRNICRNATGIMGISRRQLNYGLSFSGRGRQDNDGVFPLGYRPSAYAPEKVEEASAWWRSLGVTGDRFIGVFFGTIGPFFDLSTVIKAARALSSDFPLQLVLCGHGSRLERFKAEAAGVPAVIFPGWVDGPKIEALMRMANVGLAPYAEDAHSMALPNKPFEYFSGSLPVISSIQSELKDYLDQHKAGITYRASSVEELCAAIRELQRDPAKCEAMGKRAHHLLLEHFTTDQIYARMEEHMLGVVERYAAAQAK